MADGDLVRTIPIEAPDSKGVVFIDGFLWIADTNLDKLHKVDPFTGDTVNTPLPFDTNLVSDLAWDGSVLWGWDGIADKIIEISRDTGATLSSIPVSVPASSGIAVDDDGFWLHDWNVPEIIRVDRTGTIIKKFASPTSSTGARLHFDGLNLWQADISTSPDVVRAIDPETGNVTETFVIDATIQGGNGGVTSEPGRLWVISAVAEKAHLLEASSVPGDGPTTEEEIFQATYANASAAPPKQTALIRPLDVQRSIDTDVSWLAGNPKEWTVDVIIEVGEEDNYRPGNVFFVRADQPGLRAGRKVLLKGFAARDIRPTEFVTCIFTAPSETA